MSRPQRLWVFGVGAAGMFGVLAAALLVLPAFGASSHPYRDHAIAAAVHHATANVVSSVNFDLRGIDTLGEESIFLASVLGVAALLRPAEHESVRSTVATGRTLDSTRLIGYVMLPVTLLLGFDVVAHGHLTPGGGFQGGVVLGTGVHLLYLSGSYRDLDRARPLRVFEWGEALGAGAFAAIGIAGMLAGGAFLENVIPQGTLGTLFSGGTVPLLNGAVGIEVASGVVVLIAKFLEQVVLLRDRPGP